MRVRKRRLMPAIAAGAALAMCAAAQNYNVQFGGRLSFDRPESWALKYFASAMLPSGLEPAQNEGETEHAGSLAVGLELDWLPALSAAQERVGYYGTSPEDLNKAPVLVRPQVRVGLPWRLTAIVGGLPPFEVFGVHPHILDLGLERPIVAKPRWVVRWHGYGQLGSIRGAFTCPQSVLVFPPGSFNNPEYCVGQSNDTATLRDAGTEFQVSYRSRRFPKLVPHAASGVNYISGIFQVHAPLLGGVLDQTRLWTRGFTVSETGGASYLIGKRAAFTVDVFYSPLWVERTLGAPRTNDGLFNVRGLLTYNIR